MQNKEGRSSVDLSSGIKITPVYVDASPRPAAMATTHCGQGDQNSDDLVADAMADDCNNEETHIDLSVVGKPLRNEQNEPS